MVGIIEMTDKVIAQNKAAEREKFLASPYVAMLLEPFGFVVKGATDERAADEALGEEELDGTENTRDILDYQDGD